MVFGIFIAVMLLAIGYFHYVQGFLSATISAVIAIFSAVIAVGYYETLVEGPLAGYSPEWMPALLLLGLFALSYVILRTIFDKAVPGQVQLPAVLDKIGGAVMGLVAGVFALGVVAIAAQQLPFGPSVGGYTRYDTYGQRNTTIPGTGGVGRGAASKDAATFDEIIGDTFDTATPKTLLVPVDDAVVNTVEHLSDNGSLSAGKPMQSVHPDLLQELFGSRIGVEGTASRTVSNLGGKQAVEVVGVYEAPPLTEKQMVDHEFKKIRNSPVKLAGKVPSDEARIIVRVKFNAAAADPKDKKLRMSPGSIRIAARRPPELGAKPEPYNYFPVGTLDPIGLLYLNKIDDFLFIDTNAKKLDGSGEAPAEVDFVFQVKRDGFFDDARGNPVPRIAEGTFLEVKKLARVDLGSGDVASVKPGMKPLTVLAVRRKKLNMEEGGQAPLEPGKGGGPVNTPPPATGGGGGELGQRLVGTWENRGLPGSPTDVYTFTADGGLTIERGNQSTSMKWVAAGPPQGETLTIKSAPAGADPSTGQSLTIVFADADTFQATDATGANRRFVRSGGSSAAGQPPANQGPDAAKSKMVGTWVNDKGFTYTFSIDGKYTGADPTTNRSGSGTWKVLSTEGDVTTIEMTNAKGVVSTPQWKLAGNQPNEIVRVVPEPPTTFKRKS